MKPSGTCNRWQGQGRAHLDSFPAGQSSQGKGLWTPHFSLLWTTGLPVGTRHMADALLPGSSPAFRRATSLTRGLATLLHLLHVGPWGRRRPAQRWTGAAGCGPGALGTRQRSPGTLEPACHSPSAASSWLSGLTSTQWLGPASKRQDARLLSSHACPVVPACPPALAHPRASAPRYRHLPPLDVESDLETGTWALTLATEVPGQSHSQPEVPLPLPQNSWSPPVGVWVTGAGPADSALLCASLSGYSLTWFGFMETRSTSSSTHRQDSRSEGRQE